MRMTFFEAVCAFLLGGTAYVLLEILWRGHSHMSMFFAGGLAFLLLHGIFSGIGTAWPLFAKCLWGAAVITSIEFLFGAVVNLEFQWNVWDYSTQPLNLYGQICLPYTLLWGLLTIPIVAFSRILSSFFIA